MTTPQQFLITVESRILADAEIKEQERPSGEDHFADHRAGTHDRGHHAVGGGPVMEYLAGHQRQRHLELPGQRADHRDHDERDEQFGCRSHVAQALPDLPFLAGDALGREQFGLVHGGERDQHGRERQGVAGKAQGQAVRPSWVPLWVRSSTTKDCATVCIQVPATETSWPKKKSR